MDKDWARLVAKWIINIDMAKKIDFANHPVDVDDVKSLLYSHYLGYISWDKARKIYDELLDGKNLWDCDWAVAEASSFIDEVFAENPDQVEKARSEPKVIGWLVGQVMQKSKGKADPKEVKESIIKKLS